MKQEGQVSLRALEDSSAAAADSWVCVGGHLIIVTWGQRPSLGPFLKCSIEPVPCVVVITVLALSPHPKISGDGRMAFWPGKGVTKHVTKGLKHAGSRVTLLETLIQ